jgi:hypothetical protein
MVPLSHNIIVYAFFSQSLVSSFVHDNICSVVIYLSSLFLGTSISDLFCHVFFSLVKIYIIDVIQLSLFLCMLVWWYKCFSSLSDNTIECWVLIGTGVWIFSLLKFLCICTLWFKLVVIWTSFFYLYINFPPVFFGLLFLLEVLYFPFFSYKRDVVHFQHSKPAVQTYDGKCWTYTKWKGHLLLLF